MRSLEKGTLERASTLPQEKEDGSKGASLIMRNIIGDVVHTLRTTSQRLNMDNSVNAVHRRARCMIYPEDHYKEIWDLAITLVLLFTCIYTPIEIAFDFDNAESRTVFQFIIKYLIDSFFLLDIIIIFNSAYYNEDSDIIEDRKSIIINYITGWFLIDLLAIIPFDMLLNSTSFNELFRVARFGRLYKLIKLTRLIRVLKIMKEKSKLLKYINEFLKISLGFERLFFFILIFFILTHICTCLWLIIASLYHAEEDNFSSTWLESYTHNYESSLDLYTVSFYWTITTITTVGYGDISGSNNLEKTFCSIVMVIGVFGFSFANGSLTSIIQNYDQTNAHYNEKMQTLNKIIKDYNLPLELQIKLRKSIGYENKKYLHDINMFIEELPHNLKIIVSLYIYEQRYCKIKFFKNRTPSFISWVCPLLKPQYYTDNQNVYTEGDSVNEIFFLIAGECNFVLPSFKNVAYISIKVGNTFGVLDIVGSIHSMDFDLEEWYQYKGYITRQFSVSAYNTVELLTLNLNYLNMMQQEFLDCYESLFEFCTIKLRKAWMLKLSAIKSCNEQQSTWKQIKS